MMLSRREPGISHLLFEDDLLLFGGATVEGATCLRKVLEYFCSFSGYKVS